MSRSSKDKGCRRENLPALLAARPSALIVEFDDGDRYPGTALDLVGIPPHRPGEEAGEFEISVVFRDCLERSRTLARAWREGPLRTENCGWTSQPPIEPVRMRYT